MGEQGRAVEARRELAHLRGLLAKHFTDMTAQHPSLLASQHRREDSRTLCVLRPHSNCRVKTLEPRNPATFQSQVTLAWGMHRVTWWSPHGSPFYRWGHSRELTQGRSQSKEEKNGTQRSTGIFTGNKNIQSSGGSNDLLL